MSAAYSLRIGIIGCGAISAQHIEAIGALPETRLVGVVDASEARAQATGERLSVPWSTKLEDLIERDDVDAVTICTPSGLHPGQARAALRAGKHVLVEKPIALSVAEAEAVVEDGHARARIVATVSQRRFEPAMQALHEAIAAGALGRISLIMGESLHHRPQSYYDSAPWRGTVAFDGGVLMNQAIHVIDLVRWIGGSVRSVGANLATLGHQIEVEDTATLSLLFTNGTLGEVVATTCAVSETLPELRIYGENGCVRIAGHEAVEWEVPGITRPPRIAGPEPPSASLGSTATWGANAIGYLRQYADFAEAVHAGRPPAVTGEDGRNAVEVVTAAYEASRTGRVAYLREAGR